MDLAPVPVVASASAAAVGLPGGALEPFGAIRALHHRLAREVASGASLDYVALACGVPVERVASLLRSPAFRELVAHYRTAGRSKAC